MLFFGSVSDLLFFQKRVLAVNRIKGNSKKKGKKRVASGHLFYFRGKKEVQNIQLQFRDAAGSSLRDPEGTDFTKYLTLTTLPRTTTGGEV